MCLIFQVQVLKPCKSVQDSSEEMLNFKIVSHVLGFVHQIG